MKSFSKLLLGTAAAALSTAFSGIDQKAAAPHARRTRTRITPKAGKKGQWGRRLIRYERTGPFHRQVAVAFRNGEVLPVMQKYFKHRVLHATKGWREYHYTTVAMGAGR